MSKQSTFCLAFDQDYPELCLDNDKTHELGFSHKRKPVPSLLPSGV